MQSAWRRYGAHETRAWCGQRAELITWRVGTRVSVGCLSRYCVLFCSKSLYLVGQASHRQMRGVKLKKYTVWTSSNTVLLLCLLLCWIAVLLDCARVVIGGFGSIIHLSKLRLHGQTWMKPLEPGSLVERGIRLSRLSVFVCGLRNANMT